MHLAGHVAPGCIMRCMQLSDRLDYPAAPDAVWAMYCDPAFREQVCTATGATSHHVDVTADEAGGTVTVTRVLPARMSESIRKLVGDTVTVTQTESWGAADSSGTRHADVTLRVEGKPASMTGTHTLAPAGTGCSLQVVGDVKVAIPFLGGRLESELAKVIGGALRREQQVGQRYLA
jgi:hypothetical protein